MTDSRVHQLFLADSSSGPLTEDRVREIIRDEIKWALSLRGSPAPAPTPKVERRGAPRGPRKSNLARYRLMANRYEEGATFLDVAVEFGCAEDTVKRAVKLCGVEPRPATSRSTRYQRNPHVAQMVAMREAGAKLEDIASKFSITRERVRQLLRKAGIETHQRPLNESEKAGVQAYVAGASLVEAAERIGVSATGMRSLIVRSGNTIRPGKRRQKGETLRRSEIAARLYREGKKLREIAQEIGLSKPEMVYRLLAIAGVSPNRFKKRT